MIFDRTGDNLRYIVFFLLLRMVLCSQVPFCFRTYNFTQTFTTRFCPVSYSQGTRDSVLAGIASKAIGMCTCHLALIYCRS